MTSFHCSTSVVCLSPQLLQLEKRDLQREIIAACTSGCTGDDKGKQQSRVFLDKEEVRFMHLLLCLMEADSVSVQLTFV